ncbi:hypothetical protein [Streptomyces sp. NPDC002962]|uniref:hypothetical protein n=1 Tax=Streptomyces sp. NPDC002962 TaxID=3364674 RepID=UPI0036C1CF4F
MDELDLDVYEELLQTVEAGLSRAPNNAADPDEGRIDSPDLMWRRGLTRERRQELNDAAARGETVDKGPCKHGWQYYIVYRPMSFAESLRFKKAHGVMIVHIFHESDVAARGLAIGPEAP